MSSVTLPPDAGKARVSSKLAQHLAAYIHIASVQTLPLEALCIQKFLDTEYTSPPSAAHIHLFGKAPHKQMAIYCISNLFYDHTVTESMNYQV